MKQKLERNIAMTFRVTEKERDMIREAQKESGIINMRAYLLKMAVNGLIIFIETNNINEMIRLLGNVSNSIDQIAERATESGNISHDDIEEIKIRQDEIWAQTKIILQSLIVIMEVLEKRIPKKVADAIKRKFTKHNRTPKVVAADA